MKKQKAEYTGKVKEGNINHRKDGSFQEGFYLVEKKTGHTFLDLRIYNPSGYGRVIYACLWDSWKYADINNVKPSFTSSRVGGYGYDKKAVSIWKVCADAGYNNVQATNDSCADAVAQCFARIAKLHGRRASEFVFVHSFG